METGDGRKLFVGGLPDVISEDVLRQLFEATGGTVVDLSLPRDRATGRPRGFAFVTMKTAPEAEQARRALDRSSQAGRTISVREFHASERGERPREPRDYSRDPRDSRGPGPGGPRGPGGSGGPRGAGPGGPGSFASGDRGDRSDRGDRHDRGSDSTLYAANLPYDVTREEIEGLFSERGVSPILRVHLPTTPEGRGRGFGFVTVESAEAAEQAASAMEGASLRGRPVHLSIARPRAERPAFGAAPQAAWSGPGRRDERPSPGFARAPTESGPREPRVERRFDELGPPPPPEGFRGGGEDRRRKDREKVERGDKKKRARAAKRGGRDDRDDPSRWDRDRWDDD
ncbi:MAG: hypothetical protein KIT72_10580 [Polyangiaceae bacterium]|nr:hypothetical protein [Polyangiaceae bacterium]MCW5790858.1 hypothetical protein [Polyangiaceae bacterium]